MKKPTPRPSAPAKPVRRSSLLRASLWVAGIVGVVLAGLILWVMQAPRPAPLMAVVPRSGVQEVTIKVDGGYSPATVQLAAGRPARLRFERQEAGACSGELLIPQFNIRRALPAFESTVIDLPATAPGTYAFSCGMQMLEGQLVVK